MNLLDDADLLLEVAPSLDVLASKLSNPAVANLTTAFRQLDVLWAQWGHECRAYQQELSKLSGMSPKDIQGTAAAPIHTLHLADGGWRGGAFQRDGT
jgi:hypothetical protein